MTIALGAATLNQVHLIRIQTSREGMKVNNELADDEAERQRTEHQHKGDLRIVQLEETLEAQAIKTNSFLGGFLSMAVPAIGAAIGTLVNCASVAALPLALGQAATALFAGAVDGAIVGGLSGGIGGVVAIHKENNATKAGVGIAEADRVIAESKNTQDGAKDVSDDGRKERVRARKAIARDQDTAREVGQTIRQQIGGRTTAPTLRVPGGAASKVAAANLENELMEERGAAEEARGAQAEAFELRLQGVALRREAAELEMAKRERKAWFSLGAEVLKDVGIVASLGILGGASAAIGAGAQVGGALLQGGEALEDDTEVRALRQQAAQVELGAKTKEAEGDDHRDAKRSAHKARERGMDALERLNDAQKYGGEGVMLSNGINLAAIAKVRAMVAIDEEKDARHDLASARAEELGHEEAALDLRKQADAEADAKETRGQVVAVAGAFTSAIGGMAGLMATGGLFVKDLETFQKVTGVIGAGIEAGGGIGELVIGDESSRFQRQADEVKLKAKQSANKVEDAEDQRDDAQAAAQRSWDAAIAMQRDLTPHLA